MDSSSIPPKSLTFDTSETFTYGTQRHHLLHQSREGNVWVTSKAGRTYCVFSIEEVEDTKVATFRGEFVDFGQACNHATEVYQVLNHD